VSRTIVHKVTVSDDDVEEATRDAVELDDSNEVAHTRDGEEMSLISHLAGLLDELDEGEALVIRKIII
jgi:hypothetical protein